MVESDPGRAAALFADAGPGPALEHARIVQWAQCLREIDADSGAWQRFLDDVPPKTLADRARLAMIRKLIDEGNPQEALDERSRLSPEVQPEADETLLAVDDPSIRLDAARRLTISAPSRLQSRDPDLDRQLFRSLSEEQRLQRARSWLRSGSPSRVLAELRPLRWRGENEVQRRRVVARAELDTGSPRGALRVLPSGRDAGSEDLATSCPGPPEPCVEYLARPGRTCRIHRMSDCRRTSARERSNP